MSAVQLVHPEWIAPAAAVWGAAAVCVALARLRLRERRRRLGLAPAGPGLARDVALLAALAALGLALLGPRAGQRHVRVPGRNVDLVLLFDVSLSMAATDAQPSRLGAAQRGARDLLARLLPGDRAALVAFGSRAAALAPLTPDLEALGEWIEALDTRLIVPAGSHLGEGLERALASFERGSERAPVVLLLSDGEDVQRRPLTGVAEALRDDVTIVAVGFGNEAGAHVPHGGIALRDAAGATVVSRRNDRRLARLASASGGAYFPANAAGDFDAPAVMRAIRVRAGERPGRSVVVPVPVVWTLPLAVVGIALLTGEALLRSRRSLPGAALAASLFALIAATPGETGHLEAELRERPASPRKLVALGVARAEAGEREAAARALRAAALLARDPELAALAYYDLGVVALEQGELIRARDAFFDALALDPGDRHARFNLEWTLAALDEAQEPQPPQPPEPEPQPRPSRPPSPTPAREEPEPTESEALSAEQQRRLLHRVDDDLERALRAMAGSEQRSRPQRRSVW